MGLGCWVGFRQRRGLQGDGYFLGGRVFTWPIIGLALYSTNINAIHIVSLAQEGFRTGLVYGNYEWMAPFTLIALALFFAPFYIRSRVATLPDFLEKRYNQNCRDWLAGMSIVSAVFIHIGFSLYAGAVVIKGMFGIPIMTSIITISVLTGFYTILGGLLAVEVTESIQAIVLILEATCITAIGFYHVGGWSGLMENVEPVRMTLLRGADDPTHANLPWYAVLFGYPVIGIWYWCTDQTIVQRVLGARDQNHARVGALFAGFTKIVDVFIFVMPGVICYALLRQGKLPMNELSNSVDTYAVMIRHLLPVGLRGFVAASLLAALMGSIAGALNAIATLFSYDIYKRRHPDVSDKKLIVIGRIVTFGAMIFAIIWSPLISHYSSIYAGGITLVSCVAPSISVVFLFGVFWRRASGKAAFTTLWVGSILGLTVFLLDWFKEYTHWNIPSLLSSFYLFCLCSAVLIVVSLFRPHEHSEESEKLVWKSLSDSLSDKGWRGIGNYKVLSVVLFVTIIVLYAIFQWQPWLK